MPMKMSKDSKEELELLKHNQLIKIRKMAMMITRSNHNLIVSNHLVMVTVAARIDQINLPKLMWTFKILFY